MTWIIIRDFIKWFFNKFIVIDNGREVYVYEDLKDVFGLSRERIRQITERALIKIGRCNYTKNLAVFMDNPEQAILSLNKYEKVKKEKENIIM